MQIPNRKGVGLDWKVLFRKAINTAIKVMVMTIGSATLVYLAIALLGVAAQPDPSQSIVYKPLSAPLKSMLLKMRDNGPSYIDHSSSFSPYSTAESGYQFINPIVLKAPVPPLPIPAVTPRPHLKPQGIKYTP